MRSYNFEVWFAEHCELDYERVASMWEGYTYRDHRYNVEIAWAAWCADLGFIKEK